MKKLVASLLFVSLLVPVTASAADFSGIYIAPKVIGGIQTGTGHFYRDSQELGNTSKSLGSRGVFGGGLALGYDFAKTMDVPLRLEVEYTAFTTASRSYTKQPTGTPFDVAFKIKSEIQSLFFNAYFDINTGTNFTPYVGAGLGIGFNRYSASFLPILPGETIQTLGSKRSTNFAWNIGLGCAYKFTDNIAVDLGYRYAQFGKGKTRSIYDTGSSYKSKTGTIAMHQFVLALRVSY